ncbi:MAG: FAD-binding protein [Maritimibacter sp.]
MVLSEADVAEIIAGAGAPLRILGGGTRDIGHPALGERLSVAGLSGVELYEPGALTLVVRAGTPVLEIEDLLAREGQRLGFEPMDHRGLLGTEGTPTIGGVAAANVSGPRRIQAGAARDFTLGARFVDGQGRVIKNGGRVMKNVTGYDLVKLLAGSWGTLGVLTELSFKVQAIPETEATVWAEGLSDTAAISALSDALGSPFDVTGAAHDPKGKTMVRIEGLEGSVSYRARALQDRLAGFEVMDGAASKAAWAKVRDVVDFAHKPIVWKVSTQPSKAAEVSAQLSGAGIEHEVLYDWGGGLMWIAPEEASEAVLRAAVWAAGGHATLVKAPLGLRGKTNIFEPQPAHLARLTQELKQKFDPKGILNPGLMGGAYG